MYYPGAGAGRRSSVVGMIRPATSADIPALLDLIRELALYEREPDAVETSEDALRASLFGSNPAVFAHVAEHEGGVVGCAIWFLSYSTWTGTHGIYLEDLIVSSKFRGHGYGRQLMTALAGVAVSRGYQRFEWSVLDWNEPSIAFYRSLGARPQVGWTTYRLAAEELRALAGAGAGDDPA